jgi:hypothetical protein
MRNFRGLLQVSNAASADFFTLRCSDVYRVHRAKACVALSFIFTKKIATYSTFPGATSAL